jgi:hypothetical protein
MAKQKASVMIHKDNFKAIRRLSDAEKLALLNSLMSDIDGTKSEPLSERAEVVKEYIDDQNERFSGLQKEKADKRWGNNAERTDDTANAEYAERADDTANASVPITVTVSNSVSVSPPTEGGTRAREDCAENLSAEVSEVVLPRSNAPPRENLSNAVFRPPSLDDVRAYFAKQKFKASSELFYDYYAARDWANVADWYAAARAWEKRQPEFDERKGGAVNDAGNDVQSDNQPPGEWNGYKLAGVRIS